MCDGAAYDAECCDKADPVGVDVGGLGGFEHEGADGVVAAQMSPDLLEDQVGGTWSAAPFWGLAGGS